MARTQELIDKYEKLGLTIPLTYKEHLKNWDPDDTDECSVCYKHWVNIQTFCNGLAICFSCHRKNWKSRYAYDEDIFNALENDEYTAEEIADELFWEFQKEAKE